MAALRAAMAARRSEEMVALAALAALAAPAATGAASSGEQWRLVAPAAMPVLSERAAMAATEPEVRAGMAVTAVTAATLMAVARLVAMAAPELRSGRTIRWTLFAS